MGEPAFKLPEDDRADIRPNLRALEGGNEGDGVPKGRLATAGENIEPSDLKSREEDSAPTRSLFNTEAVGSAGKIKGFLLKKSSKRLLGGGFAAGIVGLILSILGIASGPLQIIHLSQILQLNFANQENASETRTRGLYRWAKTGEVGQTRIGYFGAKRYEKIKLNLAKEGIKLNSTKLGGQFTGATIDLDKSRQYRGYSAEKTAATIAADNGITPDKVKISGRTATFAIPEANIGSKRAVLKNYVRNQNLGKVASAVQFRTLTKYYNVPSWLHPLKRVGAFGDSKLETALIKSKAYEKFLADREAKVNARSALAQERTARIKGKLTNAAGGVGILLTGTAAICIANDVVNEIPEINRENVVIPAIQSGVDLIALGEQIRKGQDVDIRQLEAVSASFKNKNGNTIWESRALRSEQNQPGGTDINPDTKAAFSPNTTAAGVQQILDEEFQAGTICSTAGQIFSGILGIGLLFLPPGGWIAKGISVGAGIAATAAILNFLPDLLSAGPIKTPPHQGPEGGNIDAYGARAAANAAYVTSGGAAVSPVQSAALEQEARNKDSDGFKSKNLASRLFDIKDRRSLAAGIITKQTPDAAKNVTGFASYMLSGRAFAALPALLSPKTFAAESTAYDYGFPRYAIPSEIINNKNLENPYANAKVAADILEVSCKLSSPCGEDYIEKAAVCFGVGINKGPTGWNVVGEKDVNPATAEYIAGTGHDYPQHMAANCADSSDSWERIRLFIFDTRLMAGYSCYEGDDEACGDIGYDQTTAPAAAPAPAAVTGTSIVGDIGFSSNAVNCATNTKDLGVVTSQYSGASKKETGELQIRICQVSSISGNGEDASGSRISGGIVVNSRVSGAWQALGEKAKAEKVNLDGSSSFRLRSSCGGSGDGRLCATANGSMHQLGVAIDFTGPTAKNAEAQTCAARMRNPGNPTWDWLNKNAAAFGFRQYTAEAWHWDALVASNRCGGDGS